MAGSENNNSLEDESGEEIDETSPKAALSTSFTISFEDENQSDYKQKKIMKTANMYVRRHVRTLSLPIANACVPKQPDGKSRCNGHETDLSSSKRNEDQSGDRKKDVKPTKRYFSTPSDNIHSKELEDCRKQNGNCEKEPVSDSDSEGGTYTLDKGNEEVLVARKTIDQVFGIRPVEEAGPSSTEVMNNEKQNKSRMVDEWIEHSASAIKTGANSSDVATGVSKTSLKNKLVTYVSKIPSPVFGHREFNPKGSNSNISSKSTANETKVPSRRSSNIEPGTLKQIVNSPTNGDIDTASYLKETENIVAALHNRLQSDLKQCDETAKESSTDKYSNTKFNRAFSLRRDRLKKPAAPVINITSVPVRKNSVGKYVTQNSRASRPNGYTPPTVERKTGSSRLVITKPSSAPSFRSKEPMKTDDSKKKIYQRPKASGGFRSNSSLSTQEIEFQNWKRRKSYDPLKAAAEDRKKKSMMQPVAGCSASVSTAALTNKQKSADQNENDTRSETSEKGITRSASFHGLRNKNGYERFMASGANNINRSISSRFISNDNSNSSEDLNNLDEDDWIVPKPPSTSLQNTPPESVSSRLSLLSHAMSNSSVILSSSSNTKVNFMTLLNVTELTREIRSAVSSMTNSFKSGIEISDEFSISAKRNGHSLESRTECSENIDADNEENSFYQDNDLDLDEDCAADTGDDDSKSNDLSGDYQLNIALNNLKQILDTVQKLQLLCPNK